MARLPINPNRPRGIAFSLFHPILAGASLRERLIAGIGTLIAIVLTGSLSAMIVGDGYSLPLIVAPIGASAVLLFAVPASPLAQPWPIICGNSISALIGVLIGHLIEPMALAAGAAVAFAIVIMSLTRSLHPPGGAAALTGVLAGPVVERWDYWFPLLPVALNSCLLVAIGIGFHRAIGGSYPHRPLKPQPNNQHTKDIPAPVRVGFTEADIDVALEKLDESFDITRDDLARIFQQVDLAATIRAHQNLSCGDIMSRDVIAINNLTQVSTARNLLIKHNIRTLPVTDEAGILLGTVGLRDLLDDSPVIKTARIAASAKEQDPALSLLPVLTDGRSHAVIITDEQNKVIGLISQTDLLSAVARLLR